MNAKPVTRTGFIMLELAVALFVVGVLVILAAGTITEYARTRDHYAWREAATWAAEAQLQRLLAGAPRDSRPPSGSLPNEITLAQHAAPGQGPWTGFDLITVTATVTREHHKPIHESARFYLPRPEVTP